MALLYTIRKQDASPNPVIIAPALSYSDDEPPCVNAHGGGLVFAFGDASEDAIDNLA
jgi:hypothetical protein